MRKAHNIYQANKHKEGGEGIEKLKRTHQNKVNSIRAREAYIDRMKAPNQAGKENPCGEIFLPVTNPIEETFMSIFPEQPYQEPMKIERPILVDGTNILEAKDFELQHLIRKAQDQIKGNEDMAKLSKKVQAENLDLEKIIKICVEQLDKDFGE